MLQVRGAGCKGWLPGTSCDGEIDMVVWHAANAAGTVCKFGGGSIAIA